MKKILKVRFFFLNRYRREIKCYFDMWYFKTVDIRGVEQKKSNYKGHVYDITDTALIVSWEINMAYLNDSVYEFYLRGNEMFTLFLLDEPRGIENGWLFYKAKNVKSFKRFSRKILDKVYTNL